MKVKITVKNEVEKVLPESKILTKIAKLVLKECNQNKAKISVTVFYVDENNIQKINKQYRNKDKPTDVISFRMVDNPNFLELIKKNFPVEFDPASKTIYLGEIFICQEVAKKQAGEWGNSEQREIVELFCHGMLHILGYDHEKEDEMLVMRELEHNICAKLDKFVY